jgi:hypothetical protein
MKANIVSLTLPLPDTKGMTPSEIEDALLAWARFDHAMSVVLDIEVQLTPCRSTEKACWATLFYDKFNRLSPLVHGYHVPEDENEIDAKVQKYLESLGIQHNRNYPKLLKINDFVSPVFDSTLDDFLAANRDDEESCEEVSALEVGASAELGGGAVPVVIVTRIQ